MSDLSKGVVYLVGAGPGDPRLITRLGWDLLNNCDAVVYDDLIPNELIEELPERVQRHYVGKRGGKPSARQPDINSLLLKLALSGLAVVRLKGGDPMIFGRAGEELDALAEAGLPVTIIPGVTTAAAAAAEAGFPLTDRRFASWLLLATGHSADSKSPPPPWEEFARLDGGTIVVYMGLSALRDLSSRLRRAGMSPSTPVLIASRVGTGLRRHIEGTLENIARKSTQSDVKSPALIFIGNTVKSNKIKSLAPLGGLAGRRVLVTRPARQAAGMCDLLRCIGAEPILAPTIDIEYRHDEVGWNRFRQAARRGGWCIFTSEAGVENFIHGLIAQGFDLRALGRFFLAAIGDGTKQALLKYALTADFIPSKFTRQALVEELTASTNLRDEHIIRVRGNLGDNLVEDALSRAGVVVSTLNVYLTTYVQWKPHIRERLLEEPPDYITFTSGSTVEGFLFAMDEAAIKLAEASRIAVIGPSTAQTARKFNLPVHLEASTHTAEGLIEVIAADAASRWKN